MPKEDIVLTPEQIINLTSVVLGTCDSLETAFENLYPDIPFDNVAIESLRLFDALVFLCAGCGWWGGIEQMANDSTGDQYCRDCR